MIAAIYGRTNTEPRRIGSPNGEDHHARLDDPRTDGTKRQNRALRGDPPA
jgi:hypothetical protein